MSDHTTYSLLLSTLITSANSPVAYCVNATDLTNAYFVVDWGKVFNNRYSQDKLVKVRCLLVSKNNTTLTWTNNTGTLRINLATKDTIPSNNGMLVLGPLYPQDVGITMIPVNHKLVADTASNTSGVNCNYPKGIQTVNVQFLNMSESLMVNAALDYQLILYFDVYN
jgi:hypothetical protein